MYVATTKYNRSTKQYDVSIEEVSHPVFGGSVAICYADPLYAIGAIVAGRAGPTNPAKRAAVLNALLKSANSDRAATTNGSVVSIMV